MCCVSRAVCRVTDSNAAAPLRLRGHIFRVPCAVCRVPCTTDRHAAAPQRMCGHVCRVLCPVCRVPCAVYNRQARSCTSVPVWLCVPCAVSCVPCAECRVQQTGTQLRVICDFVWYVTCLLSVAFLWCVSLCDCMTCTLYAYNFCLLYAVCALCAKYVVYCLCCLY